ncbi:MAG TPA: hypothetical protein DIU10_17000 [Sulfitobacter sp.]|nr:hypothetical protein [Roseovarius sp.]HCQ59574.1 hypothetical protein [Sulfitobacter sp.]|tara:strand:- start:1601 stop:1864 length:264 start_codon:yes stop_codon:yes gene_type:complete
MLPSDRSAEEGYREFNLGNAPLSGLEARRGAKLSTRLGAFVYRHGRQFYNFEGLRNFKEKFDPDWRPVYIALPPARMCSALQPKWSH